MKIIEQYCTWVQEPPLGVLQLLERCGRVCYKSEDKITDDSAAGFVGRIMESQHESVIEHVSASVLFVTDRGVTHEIVRHRIASYSQESTRYCNYSKGKFDGGLTIIQPVFWNTGSEDNARLSVWNQAMKDAEYRYLRLIQLGATAQEARSVLPNSLKTEIVMTANLREWRYFFRLRCSQKAHPQMRDLALKALKMFQEKVPVLFDGLV